MVPKSGEISGYRIDELMRSPKSISSVVRFLLLFPLLIASAAADGAPRTPAVGGQPPTLNLLLAKLRE